MKLAILLALALPALSQGAFASALGSTWQAMIGEAADAARVHVTTSHTGVFGGVHTSTPNPTLGKGRKGDAALMLYSACGERFTKWADQNGAQKSTSNVSGGEMSLRVKASNGDYLSAFYRPPTIAGGQGTVTIVFVDAAAFALPAASAGKTASKRD